jgi:hypothetical protein
MVLREMQSLLARLYDVPTEYDVYEYLITDRRQVNEHLPSTQIESDEHVLVAQTDDGMEVSVYIDDAVIERLHKSNPHAALNDANLADYCTALEGVSHFHYLTWRAARARPVSLLELELQAEVDKYVGAMCLLTSQRAGSFPSTLHERLFHQVRFAHGLDEEAKQRYCTANRHAARFCRQLEEQFLRKRQARPEAWLAELRQFYRLGHSEKLRRTS